MKVIIDIGELFYDLIQDNLVTDSEQAIRAIATGTPLPQNATNGDVITAMFPNIEYSDSRGDVDFYLLDGEAFNTPKLITFKSWWNAPYKANSED